MKVPGGALELDKPVKLFDMKKFQQNVARYDISMNVAWLNKSILMWKGKMKISKCGKVKYKYG